MSQTPTSSSSATPTRASGGGVPGWFLLVAGLVVGLVIGFVVGSPGGKQRKLDAFGQSVTVPAKLEAQAAVIEREAKALSEKVNGLEQDNKALQQRNRESIPLTLLPAELRRNDVITTVEYLKSVAAGGAPSSGGGPVSGGDIGFIASDLARSIAIAPIDTTKAPTTDPEKKRLADFARLLNWLGALPNANAAQPDIMKAAQDIQKKAGLGADGKIGKNSWTAIDKLIQAKRNAP